tara:strand:+ start:813 stop:1136 length:324 start_codon:yes stop_codon:yes gene_type:complete
MSTKQEQLKAINLQKKELAEQQKALREELSSTKEQRKESRESKVLARKNTKAIKADLRVISSSILNVFKNNDVEEIEALADEVMETSTKLVESIRAFAEASKEPEEF